MKIKTKISLGLLFLFAMFLFIGGLGTYNLHRISQNMKSILKANFESIEYTKNMLKSLDDIRKVSDENQISTFTIEPLWVNFNKNLIKQENNITEIGEKELTENVRTNFDILQKAIQNQDFKTTNYTISILNKNLYDIMDLNSSPIIRKNQEADKIAQDAIFLMGLAATFCFLFSFSFVFNFPGYIANPIKELTESIKKVADKNYNERLHFTSKDEFGELATAFNTMARRLDEYEHSNLAHIISEKQRIETIIDSMSDPLVGLDENNKILFINTEGCAILGLPKENLIGLYAPDVALKNDLMRTLLTNNDIKPLKIFSNNKESYFEKHILNINAKEKAIGRVILLRNITQFEERDAENIHFIATVSHALKAPVSSISKVLNELEKNENGLSIKQQKPITKLKEDYQTLNKIIDELSSMTISAK
jgi:PAS domain S-box-containing protein